MCDPRLDNYDYSHILKHRITVNGTKILIDDKPAKVIFTKSSIRLNCTTIDITALKKLMKAYFDWLASGRLIYQEGD